MFNVMVYNACDFQTKIVTFSGRCSLCCESKVLSTSWPPHPISIFIFPSLSQKINLFINNRHNYKFTESLALIYRLDPSFIFTSVRQAYFLHDTWEAHSSGSSWMFIIYIHAFTTRFPGWNFIGKIRSQWRRYAKLSLEANAWQQLGHPSSVFCVPY